jgi:glutamate-1-semialdehyde 2,1-aminomutase
MWDRRFSEQLWPSDPDPFLAELADALRLGGLSAAVPTVGPITGVYVGPPDQDVAVPRDYDGASRVAATGVYGALFHALLRRGVVIAPSPYEVLFCGLAHGEEELTFALEAAADAASEVAQDIAATRSTARGA